jgi:hypothetical protein
VTEAITVSGRALPSIDRRSIAAGVLAATALVAGYLAIISFVQGPAHALEQLAADAGSIAAVTAGFGIQVALFVELRAVDRRHRAGAAVTAAGTGTSVAAMLACCAHHVVDLLPIMGLSAAAVFLDDFKGPLLVAGITTNAVGIVVIARALRRARRARAVADRARA